MIRSEICLEPDELAAWVEGRLTEEDRERALAHASQCDSCREACSALARLEDPDQPPVPALAAEPGGRIGRFKVLDVIGKGGMGLVFRARDERLDRDVAIKVVRAGTARSPKLRERLSAEARALASIDHENLVRVHEAGDCDLGPYLVMELVDGANLRAHVTKHRPDWRAALALCLAAGRGLGALHAAGFLHRDVKPDNVLVAKDGRVLLADLGLAKRIEPDAKGKDAKGAEPLTETGAIVGTPRYLAPERVAGAPDRIPGDVFAFAAMTREMLRACAGTIPASVEAVLTRGMDPDENRRHTSMAELLDALGNAARRPRTVLALAAVVIAVGVAGAIALAVGNREDPAASAEPNATTTSTSAEAPPPTASALATARVAVVATASASSYVAELPSAAPTPSAAPSPTVAIDDSARPAAPQPGIVYSTARLDALAAIPSSKVIERLRTAGLKPMTAEVGNEHWADALGTGDCHLAEEAVGTPHGVDWGKVEKVEEVGADNQLKVFYQVQGQRKRWVFSALAPGLFLDAPVGSHVFVCPGQPNTSEPKPEGLEGEYVGTRGFGGPIAAPPAFWSRKPRPRYITGPRMADGKWPFGKDHVLFDVDKAPRAVLDDGLLEYGIFYLELAAGAKRKLLEAAGPKKRVWVVAEQTGLHRRSDTDYPVLRVLEVWGSLFESPPKPTK